MRNTSSLTASPLHAQTESRMHAFNANAGGQIEFWAVWARGASTVPALCKFSCVQASGDDLQDVKNYFTFCTAHTFEFVNWDGLGNNYQQTDSLDGGTFEPLSATVDTDPGNFNVGGPPIWNTLESYDISPGFVNGSAPADWDPSGTRAGIVAALDGVNWTNLWAGSAIENSDFQFDRWQIGFNTQGTLPANGGQSGAITGTFPSAGDGSLVSRPGGFGPKKLLTGAVGEVVEPFTTDGTSNSDSLGIDLVRTQIQIRNFSGAPIPYVVIESADVASGVTILGGNTQRVPSSTTLAGVTTFYRKVSEGSWTSDRQIVQLPDAAMDGPQSISAPLGARMRNGTIVFMVVGFTFDHWMAALLGPSWADYVF